jgi:N-sulfoglucosamine sulfohydrolase
MKQRPNILFALADDWSFGHAGVYGCRWVSTPGFDRVAREGLLFDHAYTPNAKCAPSRACILTGRNPWQLKAAANHWCYFPPEFRSFPEALAAAGYATGMTGKGWAPGVALDAEGQPRQMTGAAFDARTLEPPTPRISPLDYAANFADFLEGVAPETPWCFWYGGREPHRPYEFGSGAAVAGKRTDEVDRVPGYWPDVETVRHDMLDYALAVEHFDRHLDRMLAELDRRGELDNTIVIATSDNGMPFPRVKGNAYAQSDHLPLAIRWPQGIADPGRTIPDYVSFADLAPTLIEAAGLRWAETGLAPPAGRALQDLFDGRSAAVPRDHVLIGQERHDVGRPGDAGYPVRGIIKDGWIYLRNFEPDRWPACDPQTGYLNTDGSPTKTVILEAHRRDPADPHWALCFGQRGAEELYHCAEDPDCLQDLASDPACRPRLESLRAQLYDELTAQEDPRLAGRGGDFDRAPCADASVRGFYERYMAGEKMETPWVEPGDFESR